MSMTDFISPPLRKPLRTEAEARVDIARAKELSAMIQGKTSYRCGDCGNSWQQVGGCERCPVCHCPSPIVDS